MYSSLVRLSLIALASLLAVSQGRADYMNWSYSTSAVPPGFNITVPDKGSGAVQLTPYTNATSGASIPVLAYVTSATTPVTFDANNSTYTLTVTIKDLATNDTKNLTFGGAVGGNLTPTTSSLVNTFTSPSQSVTFDGHTYTVTLPSSVNLKDPSANQQNILATVSVTTGSTGGGGVTGAPEPASCLLGSLGFALVGATGCWKRLRRRTRQMA